MDHFSEERALRDNWNEVVLTDRSGTRMLFSELVRRICRLHILFEEAGISSGDMIALCDGDSVRRDAARLAVLSYGAAVVEVPHDFSVAAATEVLRRSDSTLLLIDGASWRRLNEAPSRQDLPDAVSLDDGSALRARSAVARAAKRVDALYAEQYPQGICVGDVSVATVAELLAVLREEKRETV